MKDVSDAFVIIGLVIFTVCSCICDYHHDRRLKVLERRCDEMCLRLGRCLTFEPSEVSVECVNTNGFFKAVSYEVN